MRTNLRPSKTADPAQPKPRRSGTSTRGRGKRLTYGDRFRLLELHRAQPDLTYDQLAVQCGVDRNTARLTILAASRSAADLMAAYAAPMLDDWIKASGTASARGDHRPAKDWLLHAGAIEPIPDTSRGSGPAVVIINAPLPGMPGYAPAPEVLAGGTTYEVRGTSALPVEQTSERPKD